MLYIDKLQMFDNDRDGQLTQSQVTDTILNIITISKQAFTELIKEDVSMNNKC